MTVDLTFLVGSYQRPRQLDVLLRSLLAQEGDYAIEVFVAHRGRCVANDSVVYDLHDGRVSYHEFYNVENTFGFAERAAALPLATGRYVCCTNDDNYYLPSFVRDMMESVRDWDAAFAWCDMLHSKGHMVCQPAQCRIDLGAFVVARELAIAVPMPIMTGGTPDGLWAEQLCAAAGRRIYHVPYTLFVHN